jgi:hypothetical protein
MVAYFEMAAVDHARASGPELFCPIVCVEHNHVGDLWPLRARHANDLRRGEMKGLARPRRNDKALSEADAATAALRGKPSTPAIESGG